MVRPDARVVVGLQLQPHGQLIVLFLIQAAPRRVDLVAAAHQVLHVVAHFVGDHVRLGKVTGSLEPVPQILVETQINIYLFIAGTLKWTHGILGKTAGRLYSAPE